jgi:hypothetical protein
MPKYFFNLEKSLDFQLDLTEKLTDICETTDCEYCEYRLLCNFNINMTTQLLLLKRK